MEMAYRKFSLSVLGSQLDLSRSHEVIGHVTIRIPYGLFPTGGPLEPSHLSLTVSEIFNAECDVMVDMTLNYL